MLGTAEKLDPGSKTVILTDGKSLKYDWLILATGSRLKAPLPLKNLNSTEATKKVMTAFVAKIEESKDIVIGGAGPTGIEMAGKIAGKFFTRKTVHLVSSTFSCFRISSESEDWTNNLRLRLSQVSATTVLSPESNPQLQKAAMSGLLDLGIDIKLPTRVISTSTTSTGRTEIIYSDG